MIALKNKQMRMMKKINNSKTILKNTIQIAREAGELLLGAEKKIHKLKIMAKDAQGVASSADFASEKFIIRSLKAKYPNHLFLAEENSYQCGMLDQNSFAQAQYCWVIDPLDGTHNFLSGLNYYSVCIGLANYGKPILGVVYRPSTKECFYASEGEGAFLKDFRTRKTTKLLKKQNNHLLSDSMLCTGFASEKGGLHKDEFAYFQALFRNSRGIRRMGSAALDLCLVAQGIFDGFWEKGLSPWDVAAAGVICQEAGVNLSDFSGEQFHPFATSILAARPPLFTELLKLLREITHR